MMPIRADFNMVANPNGRSVGLSPTKHGGSMVTMRNDTNIVRTPRTINEMLPKDKGRLPTPVVRQENTQRPIATYSDLVRPSGSYSDLERLSGFQSPNDLENGSRRFRMVPDNELPPSRWSEMTSLSQRPTATYSDLVVAVAT